MKISRVSLYLALCLGTTAQAADMKLIPAGEYTPFLNNEKGESVPVKIEAFWLDRLPVTNREFKTFIAGQSKWSSKEVAAIFADENYLKHWPSLANNPDMQEWPVVNISWFAARAFCRAQGKRLPTLNEWEYASDASNPQVAEVVLRWYGKVNDGNMQSVRTLTKGKWDLKGMHGSHWEWVSDYNSVMLTQDSRNLPTDKIEGMFCGGGSLRSKDAKDYASFMRHAFRSGLEGKYTYSMLGFRCAKDQVKEKL